MSRGLARLLKAVSLPWHAAFLPLPREGCRPFFGTYTKPYGGPDLKLRKLKAYFGNHWFNHNVLYVVSGKPLPLDYVACEKRRGCGVIWNQNGVYYPAWYRGPDWREKNRVFRRYQELADYVIYQSRFCLECSKEFVDGPEKPSAVLYNAVEAASPALLAPGRPAGPFRVLAANYFNPAKDYLLDTLLRTAAALKGFEGEFELLIAGHIDGSLTGDMPAGRWMAGKTKERGVANIVRYLGPYRPEEAGRVFSQADALLHVVYNDASPNIVLEAMAVGLPVVFSRSGGTPELVGEAGVGLEVPRSFEAWHAPEPERIVEAIRRARDEKEALSSKARERVRNLFSLADWLEKHKVLMNSLVKREGS